MSGGMEAAMKPVRADLVVKMIAARGGRAIKIRSCKSISSALAHAEKLSAEGIRRADGELLRHYGPLHLVIENDGGLTLMEEFGPPDSPEVGPA